MMRSFVVWLKSWKATLKDETFLRATCFGVLVLSVLSKTFSTLRVSENRRTVASARRMSVVSPTASLTANDDTPYFGGLEFTSLQGVSEQDFGRKTDPRDEQRYHAERAAWLEAVDDATHQWMALDQAHEEGENHNRECRNNKWRDYVFPTCNAFHELSHNPLERTFLGSGLYRIAWLVGHNLNLLPDDAVVMKRQLLTAREDDWERQVNDETLLMNQREAIIMERLSGSPRIIDIYGHCGTSILVEAMSQNAFQLLMPGSGLESPTTSLLSYLPFHRPRLSTEDKLDLAITMSESIADMHGFEGGVMLNSDISLSQFLYGYDDSHHMIVKLNDFNIASMPPWNETGANYCKVNRLSWDGRIYAPEQYSGGPIDESVDVYSMGNIIYSLLTEMLPFYDVHDQNLVGQKVLNRERPFVDKQYRQHNYIEGRLVEIMERMWEHNASERPDIFEVVRFLKETKDVYRSRHRGRLAAWMGNLVRSLRSEL